MTCGEQSEGTDHPESAGSDVEIIDKMEHKQPEVDIINDWEMDDASEHWQLEGSESDSSYSTDGRDAPMHLIHESSPPPNPTLPQPTHLTPPHPDKPGLGATPASAPLDLVSEPTSKPTVTSAIRRGLTDGVKTGLFKFFSQGTREQNNEYHARETEHSEGLMQDDRYRVTAARLQQVEVKKERARIRKKKQREVMKRTETQLGLRSPGGRKRRVSVRSIKGWLLNKFYI